jgi:phage-related protein
MTIRRIIETIFMPLKAISKLIDFISGIMPYPISAVKEIKTVLKSLVYGAISVWRPFYHIVNICFEVVDETIKQVAITL